jgi:hypothetical protein
MSRTEETRNKLWVYVDTASKAHETLIWERLAVGTGLSSHTLRRFHNGAGMHGDNVDKLYDYLNGNG